MGVGYLFWVWLAIKTTHSAKQDSTDSECDDKGGEKSEGGGRRGWKVQNSAKGDLSKGRYGGIPWLNGAA